eukprot:967529-Pyramimonas_sp.AAC.1
MPYHAGPHISTTTYNTTHDQIKPIGMPRTYWNKPTRPQLRSAWTAYTWVAHSMHQRGDAGKESG